MDDLTRRPVREWPRVAQAGGFFTLIPRNFWTVLSCKSFSAPRHPIPLRLSYTIVHLTYNVGNVEPTRTKLLLNPTTDKKPTTAKARPLEDKTPFPNRAAPVLATPLPGETKLARLLLDAQPVKNQTPAGATPASAPRPSATRTHVRAPRTSGSAIKSVPAFAGLQLNANPLQFQTPAINGRPWDVSPLAPSPIALPATVSVPEEENDDLDEIEYMPPKMDVQATWVPPYEFDLPNYGEVGRALRAGACAYPVDDEHAQVDFEVTSAPEVEGESWAMPVLRLPTLDPDDPFRPPQVPRPTRTQNASLPPPPRLQPISCQMPTADARRQAWAGQTQTQAQTRIPPGLAMGTRTRASPAVVRALGTQLAVRGTGAGRPPSTRTPAVAGKARAPAPATTSAPKTKMAGTGTGTTRSAATRTQMQITRPTVRAPSTREPTTSAPAGKRAALASSGSASSMRRPTASRAPGSGSGSSTVVGRSSATAATTSRTAPVRPAATAASTSTRPSVTAATTRSGLGLSSRHAASTRRPPPPAAAEPDGFDGIVMEGDVEAPPEEDFVFDV
ncbi:hypothetical protein B0H19DRAFT_1096340 [Mycena capillaripes]|nr:hypothetical protein B0H19DRAFT_1096340 [Mycena capillaripes]